MTNKIRILCIAPLPPPVHGSAMMTQYIKNSNHINKYVDLDWVNLSTSRKMTEIGHFSLKKIVRFITSYFKVFAKLITKKYDKSYLAITCYGVGFLKDAPFVLMCKLFGKRVIIHQHNRGMSQYSSRPLYRWLLKLVYKNTDVILLSKRLYNDISAIVNYEQIHICPNGIPKVSYMHNKVENNRPRILFLSNLTSSKGVYIVLDACEILYKRNINYECVFVGAETHEIDAKRFNEEIAKRNLSKVVEYKGKKYGNDKYNEFFNADIFTFPTYNDTFGLVVLEAMQASLPTVASDVGALPDIIDEGNTGYIVRCENAVELANKLEILICTPALRKSMGEKALKRYNEKYTVQIFEQNILDILLDNS